MGRLEWAEASIGVNWERVAWAGLRAALIGGGIGGAMFLLRFAVWEDRIPPAVSGLRWVIGPAAGALTFLGLIQAGLDSPGDHLVPVIVAWALAASLRNGAEPPGAKPRKQHARLAALLLALGLLAMSTGAFLRMGPVRGAITAPFVSREARFSVMFPGTPTESTEFIDSPLGWMRVTTFMAEASDAAYDVAYADMPIRGDANAALDGARDQLVAGSRGQLLREVPITLDGHPGRGLDIRIPAGIMWARIFMVDERSYNVMVVAKTGTVSASEANRFLDSFTLIRN